MINLQEKENIKMFLNDFYNKAEQEVLNDYNMIYCEKLESDLVDEINDEIYKIYNSLVTDLIKEYEDSDIDEDEKENIINFIKEN